MKVRLFGKDDCDRCKTMQKVLDSSKIGYFFIDADAKSNQILCDANDIDELPHIQILDDNNTVVFSHAGICSPKKFAHLISGKTKHG